MACIDIDLPTLVRICTRRACAVFACSCNFCRLLGGGDASRCVCPVLWVGLASAAHHSHALGRFCFEVARAALAMASNMGSGLVGGDPLGPLGAAPGQFLAELCSGWCFDAV